MANLSDSLYLDHFAHSKFVVCTWSLLFVQLVVIIIVLETLLWLEALLLSLELYDVTHYCASSKGMLAPKATLGKLNVIECFWHQTAMFIFPNCNCYRKVQLPSVCIFKMHTNDNYPTVNSSILISRLLQRHDSWFLIPESKISYSVSQCFNKSQIFHIFHYFHH